MPKFGVHDVPVRYGKVPALADVPFTVEERERLFISCPNGAGKSSQRKAICGGKAIGCGAPCLSGVTICGPKNPDAISWRILDEMGGL